MTVKSDYALTLFTTIVTVYCTVYLFELSMEYSFILLYIYTCM